METQMQRVIEISFKIDSGLKELAKQQEQEIAEEHKMIQKELRELQDKTQKFSAANVDAADPAYGGGSDSGESNDAKEGADKHRRIGLVACPTTVSNLY